MYKLHDPPWTFSRIEFALTWSDSHSRMQVLMASTHRLGFRSLGHRPAWEYTTFATDIIGIAVTRQSIWRNTVQQCPTTNQIHRGNSIHHISMEAAAGGDQKCCNSDGFSKTPKMIKIFKLPGIFLINLKATQMYRIMPIVSGLDLNCRVFRFSCCFTLPERVQFGADGAMRTPFKLKAAWLTVACLLGHRTPAELQSWST